VDNFNRHVQEQHHGRRKPCKHCGKEFAMSNLSRHVRSVHNSEASKCPDCGNMISVSNLNKHISTVHRREWKTCELCDDTFRDLSQHNRRIHAIGKPLNEVTRRGPNIKLQKMWKLKKEQNTGNKFEEEYVESKEENIKSEPALKHLEDVKMEEENTIAMVLEESILPEEQLSDLAPLNSQNIVFEFDLELTMEADEADDPLQCSSVEGLVYP
jgi:hypothetical protein